MNTWNYNEMADNLRPEQFELLLRAYITRQLRRATLNVPDYKEVNVTFAASLKGGADVQPLDQAKWKVCLGYGTDTVGEILDFTMEEFIRRNNWDHSPRASLKLLEG